MVFKGIANAWQIFKTSLLFIKRDKSLLIVPILNVLSFIIFAIGFIALLFSSKFGFFILIANFIWFIFFMHFWTTGLSAIQAWMVHEVAIGKDATFFSGLKRALKNILDILAYAFVALLVGLFIGSIKGKGRLGQVVGGFLGFIASIAGKLVLPAMIVTERSFLQAVEQLRHAVKRIPEILTFEIGIRPLTTLLVLISACLSIVLAFLFDFVSGLVLFGLLVLTIQVFTIMINQIYYTLLYLTLIEKRRVPGLKLK